MSDLPPSSDLLIVSTVFFIVLIVLHLVLVWLFPLGKIGWKRVDYLWLAVASLGLVGATSDVRRFRAVNVADLEQTMVQASFADLKRTVVFMTGSAICRSFQQPGLSPPNFDAIQREYDSTCRWATSLRNALPDRPPLRPDDEQRVKQAPPVTEDILRETLRIFAEDVARYNGHNAKAARLRSASERSDAEIGLTLIAPFLLAFALALRISKVTGELCLERPPHPSTRPPRNALKPVLNPRRADENFQR